MNGISVLVVDDEPDFVELFIKRFSKRGLTVAGAGSGAEALARITSYNVCYTKLLRNDGTERHRVRVFESRRALSDSYVSFSYRYLGLAPWWVTAGVMVLVLLLLGAIYLRITSYNVCYTKLLRDVRSHRSERAAWAAR